jgi:L-erythro-3,5-diaminohexanoate dehydrogenase
MHNPVTGSGGVLVGTIREIDEIYGKMYGVAIGDTIISLTSLSWLPLYLENIDAIYLDRSEVEVTGKAISTLLKELPSKCPSIIDVVSGYYHDGDV